MAITVAAFTVTMTDAEFLKVNGVAAASGIPANSPFYNQNVTAASSSGTTTLTLGQTGQRSTGRLIRLLHQLDTIAQQYQITLTVS